MAAPPGMTALDDRGMLRADPLITDSMSREGAQQYRREIGEFLKYLGHHRCNPVFSFQFDDLMIEKTGLQR